MASLRALAAAAAALVASAVFATPAAAGATAAAAASSDEAAPDCKNHPARSPQACCTFRAPERFNVTFGTTVGGGANFTLAITRSASPLGVDRFYGLAKCSYFSEEQETDNRAGFFRVVPGFVVQFGIAGNVAVSLPWENAVIANDPVIMSNVRGTIAYAAEQDASGNACNRTTQVYINYGDNSRLDPLGFTPFGTVVGDGMAVVDKINAQYGQNPDQDSIYAQGDSYLEKEFPKLDYIVRTWVEE